MSNTKKKLLLHLNDDCLDLIFRNLSLDELMGIYDELHSRINAAVERQLHRYRHFKCSMREPPKYGLSKLISLGGFLRSIYINVGYSVRPNDVLAILQPLCEGAAISGNLRALKLEHASWTSDYVKVVFIVAPFLHVLDIRRCDVTDSQLMIILEPAKTLRMLTLLNICQLTGEAYLQKPLLNRLRCLKLNKFLRPLPCQPEELCEEHKQLTIVLYESHQCDQFVTYGPSLNIESSHEWYQEYCK